MAFLRTRYCRFCFALLIAAAQPLFPAPQQADIPKDFKAPVAANDYIRREVMVPMRDGVKLYTVIVVPKGAKDAPILLTRTPYNASAQTSHAASSHLRSILNGYDNALEAI